MVKKIFFFVFLVLNSTLLASSFYDGKIVEDIQVMIERPSHESMDASPVLSQIKTHKGFVFSQTIFDNDLKSLSEKFEKVQPQIKMQKDHVFITIKVWPKPLIEEISWKGVSNIPTKTLQKELGIQPKTIFDKESFTQGLNKVKEYYIKKGYYQAEIGYSVSTNDLDNSIKITINIQEGRSKKIREIFFKGFTKTEERDVKNIMLTKKHNILMSWLTGEGKLQEEILEQDQMTILEYFHNKGYSDAKVEIKVLEDPNTKNLLLEIIARRGTLYHFGDITIDGNCLFTYEQLQKLFLFQKTDPFSPEKVRETAKSIQEYYGRKGYIETQVTYDTTLMQTEPVYNIHYHIEEGEIFKIGLIRIYGNTRTNSNVILRESLLVPGEVFNTRKLKATQTRLESIGYFKNVNVYAVRSSDDLGLGPNYRDVNIEVEEDSTASGALNVGISSLEDFFAGLEFTERNFNSKGLTKIFKEGYSGVRGGGEYLHAKFNIGIKQQNYLISWMDPYFRDTLWRVGFEASATRSKLQSKNYKTDTYGGSVFTSYPFTPFLSWTTKYRARHEKTDVKDISEEVLTTHNEISKKQIEDNNKGLVSAIGTSLDYDSTDNAYKPHRGIRSSLGFEFAGIGGDFKFIKMGYSATYYHPVFSSARARMKYLGDIKFIEPVLGKNEQDIPIAERFFLGGENTVRGYKPFILGPRLDHNQKNPTGGISSLLLSVQYTYEVISILDVFAFIDAGSISNKHFTIHQINASGGVGLSLEVMKRSPISVGYAFPINPKQRDDFQGYFFSFGAQF